MPPFEVGGELEEEEEDDEDQEGLDQTVEPGGGGGGGRVVVVGDAAVGGAEEVEGGVCDPDEGGGELLELEEVEAGELAEGTGPDPIFVAVNGGSSDFDGEESFVVAVVAAVLVSVSLLVPPLLKLLVLGARHRTRIMDPILAEEVDESL